MTFARLFNLSSYCLIASGFIAIGTTRAMDWLSMLLFTTVFIGSLFVDTARLRQQIPNWILNRLGLTSRLYPAVSDQPGGASGSLYPDSQSHFYDLLSCVPVFRNQHAGSV
jgi:hypothetical protein